MPKFTKIGDYDIIQTKGAWLKEMFPGQSTRLQDDKQYIAYYKLNSAASSSHTWHTYKQVWHAIKWNGVVGTDYKTKKGDIYDYQVDNDMGASGEDTGRATFSKYKKDTQFAAKRLDNPVELKKPFTDPTYKIANPIVKTYGDDICGTECY